MMLHVIVIDAVSFELKRQQLMLTKRRFGEEEQKKQS
jgi:hypothetical protein